MVIPPLVIFLLGLPVPSPKHPPQHLQGKVYRFVSQSYKYVPQRGPISGLWLSTLQLSRKKGKAHNSECPEDRGKVQGHDTKGSKGS